MTTGEMARVRQLYEAEGLTLKETAAVLGYSITNIVHYLKMLDIPRRPPTRYRDRAQLCALLQKHPLTARQLAARLGKFDRSTRIWLAKLERQGLVQRRPTRPLTWTVATEEHHVAATGL